MRTAPETGYSQLLNNSPQSTIRNHEIEGATKILNVTTLRFSWLKLLLAPLLVVCTGGVLLVMMIWFVKVRKELLYSEVTSVENSTHVWVENNDETCTIEKILHGQRSLNQAGEKVYSFKSRYLRYEYNQQLKFFEVVCFKPQILAPISQCKPHFASTFGTSDLKIQPPGLFRFLFKELTTPMFFFQYFCLLLWLAEGQVYFALVILGFSVVTMLIQFVLIRNSVKALNAKLVKEKVRILRRVPDSQESVVVNGDDVVVGDVLVLQRGMQAPCDLLLFSNVVVNQAALTGQSVPIHKQYYNYSKQQNLKPSANQFNFEVASKHIVYEGTTILQAEGQQPRALALRNGFSSCKGQMLRQVLFPAPFEDVMNNTLVKFVAFMGVLCMGVYVGILPIYISHDYSWVLMIYRLGDAITWFVPPTLPVLFQIIKIVSMLRLRGKDVLVKDNQKAFESGQVTVMCLDKTGTITKNQLSISSVYEVGAPSTMVEVEEKGRTESVLKRYSSPRSQLARLLFATCNSCLRTTQGELLGDPLDVQMVNLLEKQQSLSFRKLKVNQFQSHLCRMSVVVESEGRVTCFVKGSPETIQQLSDGVPNNYQRLVSDMALKGKRVLAFAYKTLKAEEDWQTMSRDQMQKDLIILGLIESDDKLKEDSAYQIDRLVKAGISCKVVSGDNTYATVQIAKDAAILPSDSTVQILDFKQSSFMLQTLVYDPITQFCNISAKRAVRLAQLQEALNSFDEFAVTGNAFASLLLQVEQATARVRQKMLYKARVFGRMKSNQKALLIKSLQSTGLRVGMIGDGPNDCEAIRQANIGISFFDTDSSFAAPFVSQTASLGSIWLVLTQGRCCLASAVEVFRFFFIATLLKYIGAQYLVPSYSTYAQLQYILMSYALSYPLSILLAFTGPRQDTLSKDPPDYNLFSVANCVFIVCQLGICAGFLVAAGAVLNMQAWFVPETRKLQADEYYHTQSKTSVFIQLIFLDQITCMTFLLTWAFSVGAVFVCFIGRPFKKPIYTNWGLSLLVLGQFALLVVMIFLPQKMPSNLGIFQLGDTLFRSYFLGALVIAVSIEVVIGRLIIELVSRKYP